MLHWSNRSIIFLQLQKFSRAHWPIFIVNKRTDTLIYNLCLLVIVKNMLMSVFHASVLLLTEFRHNIVKVVCGSTDPLTMF